MRTTTACPETTAFVKKGKEKSFANEHQNQPSE